MTIRAVSTRLHLLIRKSHSIRQDNEIAGALQITPQLPGSSELCHALARFPTMKETCTHKLRECSSFTRDLLVAGTWNATQLVAPLPLHGANCDDYRADIRLRGWPDHLLNRGVQRVVP